MKTRKRTGHLRQRGADSWELKFEGPPDPLSGERRTRYRTFKGTQEQAELELDRLLLAVRERKYADPSKDTVADLLDRFDGWLTTEVSPKTAERYRELLRLHVRPHLGPRRLDELKRVHFADLHKLLLGAGLSARTVGHVHRVLHRALQQGVEWDLLKSNPAAAVRPPRVQDKDVEILTEAQVATVLHKLRGKPIYPIIALALATGCRRGELLGLRWKDLDLDAGRLRVAQSIEQTKAGLRIKPPKTKHGRRSIALSPSFVAELRTYAKDDKERRIKDGLGRAPDDGLVFGLPNGSPRSPNGLTKEWSSLAAELGLPQVTLHALRHTHASQLIAGGVDVLTVSRRLGHGSPVITLRVYGHLFSNTDDRAAEVIEAAFSRALG